MHALVHTFGALARPSVDRVLPFAGHATEPHRADQPFFTLANAYKPFGGLATSAEVAERLPGTGISRLARSIVAREVVCFQWHGDYWLPRFQFQGACLDIATETAALISELSPVLGEWELAQWFVTPSASLRDRTPLQAMQDDFALVHDAARLLRFVHCN